VPRRRRLARLAGREVCRFGDNMREVAVTEGDKVAAQIKFGYSVNGYGVGDLVKSVNAATDKLVQARTSWLPRIRGARYAVAAKGLRKAGWPKRPHGRSLREAARIELGLRAFLKEGDFKGFTTTFEDLHGKPWRSCPASPPNASWPTATASAPKAIGRPARCCGP
jgi:L-arabinose isomerase